MIPSARAALIAAAVLPQACAPAPRPGTPPRHVLLVTVSGLRADHVCAYGYPRPTTAADPSDAQGPDLSIDGLAAGGVTFAQAFAPSAAAAASLAALHAGSNAPAQGTRTLIEDFAAAGFRTGAFLTGAAAAAPSLARGAAHVAAGAEPDPDYDAVRQAVAWLRETVESGEERIFLWLHLSGPAAPWDPAPLGKEDFRARFTDPDYAGTVDGSAAGLAALAQPGAELAGQDLAQLVALYDAEVARANQLVGQIASVLAGRFEMLPRDLLGETAVVLAGACGAELFQHARAPEDPSSLYDASLRVLLVLRHPASLTGRRVLAEPVELRDVAPTLREWFDLPRADGADGRSLLALTDARARDFPSRPVVLRRAEGGSVRTADWHLIVRGKEKLLFHVARDPLERTDLAALEAERARALAAELAPGR